MAVFRDPNRPTRGHDGFADIAYPPLADSFWATDLQSRVPFLGAGASLGPRTSPAPNQPSETAFVRQVCTSLGVQSQAAQDFIEIAIQIALQVELNSQFVAADPIGSVRNGSYPPSAGGLARAIETFCNYDAFSRNRASIAELTGRTNWDFDRLNTVLRSIVDHSGFNQASQSLLTVASYAEYTQHRESFWRFLRNLFNTNTGAWQDRFDAPACSHRLVSRAARRYLDANQTNDGQAEDYLIITTNYDRLIERCLDSEGVAYFVLSVPRLDPLAARG